MCNIANVLLHWFPKLQRPVNNHATEFWNGMIDKQGEVEFDFLYLTICGITSMKLCVLFNDQLLF